MEKKRKRYNAITAQPMTVLQEESINSPRCDFGTDFIIEDF